MPEAGDVIEEALERLVLQLAGRLGSDGWVLRRFEVWPVAVFTRDVGSGFVATVEVHRTLGDLRRPDAWPVDVYAVFGCGYEPATALMPLLALDPEATLASEVATTDSETRHVTLSGPDGVDGTARGIAEVIAGHGLGFAEQHASVDALEAAMTDRLPSDIQITLRPVLLAAAGEHDRARALVDDFIKRGAAGTEYQEYPRFVRQLHRWLEAGGPPIPPVEETLSRLPPQPARPARPSREKARQEMRDRRAVWDQVRAQARGKTTEQLTTMLAAAFAAHGVEAAPSMLAKGVEQLQLDLRPFGRARRHLQGFTELRAVPGLVKGMFADDPEPDPEWLQPPERASYPLPSDGRRWAAVRLDSDAQDWLARVAVLAPRRVVRFALVDTWLTEENGAGTHVVVHIGGRAVGALSAADAREFAPYLAAATIFDEYVRVLGRVSPAMGGAGTALEVSRPDVSA